MHRTRSLILGAVVAALALPAIGAPVLGAKTTGTLAIVNGVPGQKVDICMNGKEVGSGVRYGGVVSRPSVAAGQKTLTFYKRDPRTCKGQAMGQTQISLSAARDVTVVVTKKAPKVLVFDNVNVGEIPPAFTPYPNLAFLVLRAAAELPADFRMQIWDPQDGETIPSPAATWIEGDSWLGAIGTGAAGSFVRVRAAALTNPADSVASRTAHLRPSRRYEWILVGTKRANARFVIIDRAVSQPLP